MKNPEWAPADLVGKREELRLKSEAMEARALKGEIRTLDLNRDLEQGTLYDGPYYPGRTTEFELVDALVSVDDMESVWKSLYRRSSHFKPWPRALLFGGRSQSLNLYGACYEASRDWINAPKLTRNAYRELLLDIAKCAGDLTQLLLQIEGEPKRAFWSLREYLPAETKKELASLIDDGGWRENPHYDHDSYVNFLLGDHLPPVPRVVLDIHKRAKELADSSYGLSQPNSPDAESHFFIRHLSKYFLASYGQPLNANVAAIARAVFKSTVDEDGVRALIRADKVSKKNRTRKKIERLRKTNYG